MNIVISVKKPKKKKCACTKELICHILVFAFLCVFALFEKMEKILDISYI